MTLWPVAEIAGIKPDTGRVNHCADPRQCTDSIRSERLPLQKPPTQLRARGVHITTDDPASRAYKGWHGAAEGRGHGHSGSGARAGLNAAWCAAGGAGHPHHPSHNAPTPLTLTMSCSWQLISRSEQTGPVAKKGATFSPADYSSQLPTLGLGNGAMIFLDYQARARAATRP